MSALLAALVLFQASSSTAEPSVEAMVAQWRAAMLRRQQAYHSARVKLKGSMHLAKGAHDRDPGAAHSLPRPIPSAPVSMPYLGEFSTVAAKRWFRKKEQRGLFSLATGKAEQFAFDSMFDGADCWIEQYGHFSRYGGRGTEVICTALEQPMLWGMGRFGMVGPPLHEGHSFETVPVPVTRFKDAEGMLVLTFSGWNVGITFTLVVEQAADFLPIRCTVMNEATPIFVYDVRNDNISGVPFPKAWTVIHLRAGATECTELREVTSLELNPFLPRTYFQPVSPYSKTVYDSTGEELVIVQPGKHWRFILYFLLPVVLVVGLYLLISRVRRKHGPLRRSMASLPHS